MNTETAPAMMAVIEITMTISISVTPRSRLCSVHGIGCIARAVAVKNHGGISAWRPKHGHRDEKGFTTCLRDRPQRRVGDGDASSVIPESGNGGSRKVQDARHGEGVVVAHVVIRRGRAVARFPGLRTQRQSSFVVGAPGAAGAAGCARG